MGSAVSAASKSTSEDSEQVEAREELSVEVKVYHCNSSRGRPSNFTISREGVVMQGSNSKTTLDIGQSYANATGRSLQRYELNDARACQLLVVSHLNSFWAVPAPEAFSRHSGTCRMLGDRKHAATPHILAVGDVLRVGSVGLVVTEVHNGTKGEALKDETIERLVRDTVSVVNADTNDGTGNGDNSSEATNVESEMEVGEKSCYCCFSDEDTKENPLVSPCDCKGDTKWIHMECLRKWHKTGNESNICSVTSVMASCSVCKATYKSSVPLPDGSSANIFNCTLPPPYVSFLVVTKHEMAKQLYNTRFQLSFATAMKPDGKSSNRDLSIGRSSASDMVLDYRTVSAHHAQVRFKDGEFQFIDAQSSNGSFLYLRKPVQLDINTTTNLRLGRSLLSLKVTRNKWRSHLISSMSRKLSRSFSSDSKEPTVENMQAHGGLSNEEGGGSFFEEDNFQHIKPNTDEHFMLIQSLALPTQLASQSPSHASNQKTYDAVSGFFKSDSGELGEDAPNAATEIGSTNENSNSNDNSSQSNPSSGLESYGGSGSADSDYISPVVVQHDQQNEQGEQQEQQIQPNNGVAAVNNAFMQNDVVIPSPEFERRDTILLPDQELLMSFEQSDEVELVDSTFIIHPDREVSARGGGDDDVASINSAFSAMPSNNSMDMTASGRQQTMLIGTPKGQASWDEIDGDCGMRASEEKLDDDVVSVNDDAKMEDGKEEEKGEEFMDRSEQSKAYV